jgi:threonine/homoserine/homoserine lactone efflux protein
VATTAGILSGVSLQIALGLTGISWLLTRGELFEHLIALAGGAWLIYLGQKGLRNQKRAGPQPDTTGQSPDPAPLSCRSAWTQGFLVNLLNPKAFLFFLSLFSVMLGPDLPLRVRVTSGGVMIAVQAIAFSTVAILVDRPRFKAKWSRLQHWLELGISVILLVLGVWIWGQTLLTIA